MSTLPHSNAVHKFPLPVYMLERKTRHVYSDDYRPVYEIGYPDGGAVEVSSDIYHGILTEYRAEITYSEFVDGRLVYVAFDEVAS